MFLAIGSHHSHILKNGIFLYKPYTVQYKRKEHNEKKVGKKLYCQTKGWHVFFFSFSIELYIATRGNKIKKQHKILLSIFHPSNALLYIVSGGKTEKTVLFGVSYVIVFYYDASVVFLNIVIQIMRNVFFFSLFSFSLCFSLENE